MYSIKIKYLALNLTFQITKEQQNAKIKVKKIKNNEKKFKVNETYKPKNLNL